jgi:signal transduction histidine kinase
MMDLRSSISRWLGSRSGARVALCALLATSVATRSDVLPPALSWGALGSSLLVVVAAVLCAARTRRQAASTTVPAVASPLEQLAEDLGSAGSPLDVAHAVENAVRAALHCDKVELLLDPSLGVEPAEPSQGLASGTYPVESSSRWQGPSLSIDVRFRGDKLGTLTASRGASASAFTRQETALVGAIVKQGSLALAHAELTRRRQQQAGTWQDERESLVETLSAEIVHEVRYPLNFFRSIFQRAAQTRVLDEEDIEIGCEEVERLERLVFDLRRMTNHQLDRHMVDIAELCGRAQAILRDRMATVDMSIDLYGGGAIECDPDKVTQVLVNLLANAVEATGGVGQVGIAWRSDGSGGVIEVWDTGPGFTGDTARLFTAGHTTKPRGTGLGLAISARLVRAHGWTIEASRHESKTMFSVSVPDRDIAGRSGRHRVATVARVDELHPSRKKREGNVA